MTTTYSVHVEVGTYVWDVTGNDADHDVAATYGLADPLTITRRWPDSDFQPNVQPDPDEATITIIAPDGATYPLLTMGDPVAVEFFSQGGFTGNGQSFYGRVASLQAKPHDLGVIYTLTCVDYLADLQETDPVGQFTYPSETLSARMARVMVEARIPVVPAFPSSPASVDVRGASPVSLYDYLVHLCEQWQVSSPAVDELGVTALGAGVNRQRRPILRQRITARRLDAVPYELEWVTNGRHVAWPPPARLTNVAGLQTITVATSASSGSSQVVDAGSVDFDATFTKTKGPDSVSRYAISNSQGVAGVGDNGGFNFTNAWPTDPPTTNIIASLATELNLGAGTPGGLVAMYQRSVNFGRPSPLVDWGLPLLTWLPWNLAVNWVMPQLGDVFTAARVATAKSPQGREWVNGVVTGTVLRVAGGRPTVDVQLGSLHLYEPSDVAIQLGASLGVCRFDSPILGTTTLAQLSTRDTFNDYALVRGT